MWPFSTRSSPENPATPLSNPARWLVDLFGGQSTAGVNVTMDKALGVPTVWRCVNLISETVAGLPLKVYRNTKDGREEAKRNPLYGMLHDQVNSQPLSSYQWRRLLMKHLLTNGSHVSRIERTRAGKPTGLWPLPPKALTVERKAGRLNYRVALTGNGHEDYASDEVLHFTGLMDDDGLDGMSPIGMLRNAAGLAIALETHAASFFKNGARPGMVLEYPSRLSPSAVANLKASIEAKHGGVENSHKVIVMEDGAKLHQVGTDPEKSQLNEARKLQRQELANVFNVPLFFLGDSDPAKANSEQQALFFLKYTLHPWLVMMEQEMNMKLLTGAQRNSQFIEFNIDGLLRGDFKARMEGYALGVQNAILQPNEARRKENLPDDPDGSKLVMQQNMSELGAMPNKTAGGNDDE